MSTLQLPAPKNFVVSSEPSTVSQRWTKWVTAFKVYLQAIGKTSEPQKIAILLHIAGTEVLEVYRNLTPSDQSFDAALETLTQYFSPKGNSRYERYVFRKVEQGDGENTDSFVIKLKNAVVACDFVDTDTML